MDFDDLEEAEEKAQAEADAEQAAAEETRRKEAEAAAARAREEEQLAALRAQAQAQEEAQDAAEAAKRLAEEPKRAPPTWKLVPPVAISFAECSEVTKRNDPGDYFGLQFPHSKEQLESWGAEWFTKAFRASGVLQAENAVTRISEIKEFVGGGAGLKATLKVEYKVDTPYLHKELFVKLPHKGGSDRYFVSCMWNHDRPELIFYIWLEKFVPFRVPKFYFGDISAKTTNYVLITEKIPFSEPGKKTFKPGEVEPPYDKHKDWELPAPGPAAYYNASLRALGKMAGMFKKDQLHPQVSMMFPMPDLVPEMPKGIPGLDVDARKMSVAKCDSFIRFIGTTAKAVFWPEITDARFLQQWKDQILHVMDYGVELGIFQIMDHDYVALTHNNLQIDNAFFWRNEANEVQVGLLDWGILACGSVAGAIQGCISGAQYEVLVERLDEFLRTFADSYAENGGPRLDLEKLRLLYLLQVALWGTSVVSNVTQVLKFTKEAEWKEIKDWMDPRLLDRFQPRVHCAQFRLVLRLWQTWDVYGAFKQWLKLCGLPETKR